MRGASAIEQVLEKTGSERLRVFVVWESILPTDWSSPTTPVLARISDLRAVQFWDRKHLIAGELKRQLSGNPPPCCEEAGVLWDVIALYARGTPWAEARPLFADGPVVSAAGGLSLRLSEMLTSANAKSCGDTP